MGVKQYSITKRSLKKSKRKLKNTQKQMTMKAQQSKLCILLCQLLSHVQLFATPWTVAHQAPLSMESSKKEYWSGQPFPSPRDLPNRGIKPRPPALLEDSLLSEPTGKSSPKKEVNNNLISPQETGKISNNITSHLKQLEKEQKQTLKLLEGKKS